MSDFKVWLNGLTSKATPVDADVIPIRDSVSATTQKLSWANLKATLATWINGGTIPASFTTLTVSGAVTATSGYPTLAPSLNLDFANSQTVDPRITCTRATTATRTNKFGLIETVASGVPRIEFNPVTLACKGLLIEAAATNLLTYSEAFDNAAWTKAQTTITANAVTSPDGAVTADKIVEDTTASSTHYTQQNAAFTTGAVTVCVYAKAAERTKLLVSLSDLTSSTVTVTADLSAGTLGSISTGGSWSSSSSSISALPNSWYRISLTSTKSLGANVGASFFLDNGSGVTYTGNGTSGLYIWGAQLEAGASATSYIPTTSAAVTRNADVDSMTGANFTSWYRQDEGTFVVSFTVNRSTVSGYDRVFEVSDNTGNNLIDLFVDPSINKLAVGVQSGGASVVYLPNSSVIVEGTQYVVALAYKANDVAVSFNGGTVQTDTVCTIPAVTRMDVGSARGAANFIGGSEGKLQYYPQRLTNAQLVSLSTQ